MSHHRTYRQRLRKFLKQTKMTQGNYKKTIKKIRKKVGFRPKGRKNKNSSYKNGGVIYLPDKYIGCFVKIEVLEE